VSRQRVPGDGPKCWCGTEATFSGYCNGHHPTMDRPNTPASPPMQEGERCWNCRGVAGITELCNVCETTSLRQELANLRSSHNALVAERELERAVVDALIAERAARDAIPKFQPKEGEFPPAAFWEGCHKAEDAHVVTERVLDALLASRAKAGR
jgi:hypothetical protein